MSESGGVPAWQDAAFPGDVYEPNEVFARTLAAKRNLDRKIWGSE